MDNKDKPVLFDCTVRDGSYAIDFKFTANDTALLTEKIAKIGFQWIEIGHGLGFGAADVGKGLMPDEDEVMIKVAQKVCGKAKLGMFFIPSLRSKQKTSMTLLEHVADTGLDFIRIGGNADQIDSSFEYIEKARKLGLIPFLNFMKSYLLSPDEFAEKAKLAIDYGAEGVYVVDSAGSMLPEEIGSYFDAIKAQVDCQMGFHGHNNLLMVIANCISAYQHGARFIDVSLCGLGRSAGNAPSEIMVSVFDKMNIDVGIDLFDLMDIIEAYMWPLVSKTRTPDMLGVTAGYSGFHSSFLPDVAKIANKYKIDLKRLVAKAGFHSPGSIDPEYLDKSARELLLLKKPNVSNALTRFSAKGISEERISNSFRSFQTLIEGLLVSKAKRAGVLTVLQLWPSSKKIDDFILSEFVLENTQLVIGRVTFGSEQVLKQIISSVKTQIDFFIMNSDYGWFDKYENYMHKQIPAEKLLKVNDQNLKAQYLSEILLHFNNSFGCKTLLIYGYSPLLNELLANKLNFETIFMAGSNFNEVTSKENKVVKLETDDFKHLNINFDLILCNDILDENSINKFQILLTKTGRIICLCPIDKNSIQDLLSSRMIDIDLNNSYLGVIDRFQYFQQKIFDSEKNEYEI